MRIVFRDKWSLTFITGAKLSRRQDGRWWVTLKGGEEWRLDDDPAEVYAV